VTSAEVRIVVRPYATSLALGFFSFGIGMLLLGGMANGWLHPSDVHTVGLLLAAFVFPLELLSAVIAFLARDTFGATGLGLFATSWLALGLADTQSSQSALSRAVGLYELGFAFTIALLAVAAFAGKPLIAAILLASAVRGAFAAVHEWHGPAWAWTASGWLAVAIFAAAMYGGIAFLLEDVHKQQVLPVFRRGASRESLEGDLRAQLADLADEAGVRKTL
jgi:succinate-acetate transporter protein